MSTSWTLSPSKVLSQPELSLVVERAQAKAYRSRHSANALINLVILRLGAFAGLRASEIAGIRICDLHLVPAKNKSYLYVPASCAKGGKARRALIWSDNTVRDLEAFVAYRRSMGAQNSDRFLVSLNRNSLGNPLTRQAIRLKTKTVCRVLGNDRVETITAHTLRHCYCSKAIHAGVPLPLVRDSAGHSSIAITNTYAHLWEDSNADWTMD